MLAKNPSERLTSNKLLRLDFITKYEGFETCEELCKWPHLLGIDNNSSPVNDFFLISPYGIKTVFF